MCCYRSFASASLKGENVLEKQHLLQESYEEDDDALLFIKQGPNVHILYSKKFILIKSTVSIHKSTYQSEYLSSFRCRSFRSLFLSSQIQAACS